ncbi:hypothetical protein HaLaN_00766, partial [Haematococcus lacustris]
MVAEAMVAGKPDHLVLGLMCAVFGGATLVATADTLNKLRNKQLSSRAVKTSSSAEAPNNDVLDELLMSPGSKFYYAQDVKMWNG